MRHRSKIVRHETGTWETAIVDISGALLREQPRDGSAGNQTRLSQRLKSARDLIEAKLSSHVDLTELADAAGFSARQLTRAFRVSTGLAPHEYIIRRRLARACELIEQRSLTLAEIAERVGFSSHAHMTSTFRKQLGMPPSYLSNKALKSEARRKYMA